MYVYAKRPKPLSATLPYINLTQLYNKIDKNTSTFTNNLHFSAL